MSPHWSTLTTTGIGATGQSPPAEADAAADEGADAVVAGADEPTALGDDELGLLLEVELHAASSAAAARAGSRARRRFTAVPSWSASAADGPAIHRDANDDGYRYANPDRGRRSSSTAGGRPGILGG